MIAGIYGMNFDAHAGDCSGATATTSVLVLIVTICVGLLPRLQAQRLAVRAGAASCGQGANV